MTDGGLPAFTVVVPTHRRPRQLAVCLQALAGLDYPRDRVGVVVVDDGSPDAPTDAVEDVAGRIDVTLLRQTNAGPARARNAGAARAREGLLAFTDDDCAPAADWLQRLAALFLGTPGPIMVGGRTVNSLPGDACATASQALIDYLYSYYNARPGGPRFFASNNMALPVDGFRRIGGFDESFTAAAAEDRDFCDRWLRSGFGMAFAPDAVVHHRHAMTLRAFWTQHFRYGQGALHFHRRHSGTASPRLEPPSFYWRLLGEPLRPAQRARSRTPALLIVALLCVAQAANAAGFACEKARRRR